MHAVQVGMLSASLLELYLKKNCTCDVCIGSYTDVRGLHDRHACSGWVLGSHPVADTCNGTQ